MKINHYLLLVLSLFSPVSASAISIKKCLLCFYIPTFLIGTHASYLRPHANNNTIAISDAKYEENEKWDLYNETYDEFDEDDEFGLFDFDDDLDIECEFDFEDGGYRKLGLIPEHKGCDDEWKDVLTEAKEFLKDEIPYLLEYENFGRPLHIGNKLLRSRLKRAIKKVKVKCHGDNKFCEGTVKGFSRGLLSFLTKRIHFCTENWGSLSKCQVVSTMAHEIGHMIGMRVKQKKHNDGNNYDRLNDRVYQFGYYARDRCYEKERNRLKLDS